MKKLIKLITKKSKQPKKVYYKLYDNQNRLISVDFTYYIDATIEVCNKLNYKVVY